MQSSSPQPLSDSDSRDGFACRPPRSRGRRPSLVDILKTALTLTETTRTGVARVLRARGLAASDATVDAVFGAANNIKSRRLLRHQQNAEKRLGRQLRGGEGRWPQAGCAQSTTVLQRLHEQRVRSITETAKSVFRHGAAGGSSVTIEFAADSTEVGYWVDMAENRDTYRGRFKGWLAREDHHHICVPRDWRTRVLARGLADLGGLMTLDAHRLDSASDVELYAATWAAQGRGYAVNIHQGYIARSSHEHFHADTPGAAFAGLRRRVSANANPRRSEPSAADFVQRYRGVDAIVTLNDAYQSGSCDYGVRSWCAAVGLDYDQGEATLAEVLDGFVKRPQVEVRRAVLHALRRHRVQGSPAKQQFAGGEAELAGV